MEAFSQCRARCRGGSSSSEYLQALLCRAEALAERRSSRCGFLRILVSNAEEHARGVVRSVLRQAYIELQPDFLNLAAQGGGSIRPRAGELLYSRPSGLVHGTEPDRIATR